MVDLCVSKGSFIQKKVFVFFYNHQQWISQWFPRWVRSSSQDAIARDACSLYQMAGSLALIPTSCRCAASRWQPENLGFCHPCRRSTWGSWLLVLVWGSWLLWPLQNKQQVQALSICLSLSKMNCPTVLYWLCEKAFSLRVLEEDKRRTVEDGNSFTCLGLFVTLEIESGRGRGSDYWGDQRSRSYEMTRKHGWKILLWDEQLSRENPLSWDTILF